MSAVMLRNTPGYFGGMSRSRQDEDILDDIETTIRRNEVDNMLTRYNDFHKICKPNLCMYVFDSERLKPLSHSAKRNLQRPQKRTVRKTYPEPEGINDQLEANVML